MSSPDQPAAAPPAAAGHKVQHLRYAPQPVAQRQQAENQQQQQQQRLLLLLLLPQPQPLYGGGEQHARAHYIDWLHASLIVLAIVHECVATYSSAFAWAARRGDVPLWLLSELFIMGNQAWLAPLLLFISGLYVRGSYRRKGPLRFLLDRTLRLAVPCLVYSLMVPPLVLWWNALALDPSADASDALGDSFRAWLSPRTAKFVLPAGPMWLVWMLWCLDVAVVVLRGLRVAAAHVARSGWLTPPCLLSCCRGIAGGSGSSGPSSSSSHLLPQLADGHADEKPAELTARQTGALVAGLSCALATLVFFVRMLDAYAFNVAPMEFVQRTPFVSFMPDYLPVHVTAFALGIAAGPGFVARLPRAAATWCLAVGALTWVYVGWLPAVLLAAELKGQRGSAAFVAAWALRTVVEQFFCVVWCLGVLVAFRRGCDVRPNWLASQVLGAAYGAFVAHGLVVVLFARVVSGYRFISAVVPAAAISLPSVVTSWVLASALRLLPGAQHVL